MTPNLTRCLIAFLLGFGLMGCAQMIQRELFGCRQNPNQTVCPK